MSRVRSILKIQPLLALGLLLACGGNSSSPQNANAQPDNQTALAQAGSSRQAADFALTTLDGDKITLDTFSDKVLIIDFWATWCPPCVKEIPHFVELYDQYSGKGLEILGVSVDNQGPTVVQKFMDKNGIEYPIAMANMEIVDAYQAYGGIPTTFIIDRSGKITEKIVGYRDKSYFEERIKKLL